MNTISIGTHAVCFVLMVCGLGSLMSAMPRHQKVVFKRSLSVKTSRLVRMLGWLLVGWSVMWTAHLDSWPFSWVVLTGHATAAALLVVCTLWFWEMASAPPRSARVAAVKKSTASSA